ncbi:unnamed protein product [Auanema sp. JU1783]|nr:unnamed protein product [Auanema sp. JU1783]
MLEAVDSGGIMSKIVGCDDHSSAIRIAFYNTLFIFLMGLSLCGLVAMYNMLYMFLSPMMWAVLVGTVLFPFKKKVTDVIKGWLCHLQDTDTSLIIGVIRLPFNIFNNISETIFNVIVSHHGLAIGASYLLLKVLSYERTFMQIISWLGRLYEFVDSVVLIFTRNWVFPILVLYFGIYAAWIYLQDTHINKKLARTLSLPIWVYLLSQLAMFFGPFRAAVFGASGLILALISAGIVRSDDSGEEISVRKHENESNSTDDEDNSNIEHKPIYADDDSQDRSIAEPAAVNCSVSESLDSALSGDYLIRAIVGLCALLWVVRHDYALLLLFIPFAFAAIKKFAFSLGIISSAQSCIESLWQRISPYVMKIVNITVAGPLRQFVTVVFTSDKILITTLHDAMDVLSSVVVMMLLALSAMFALFFVGFQLHGETVHLVRLTTNVLSSRPDWLAAAMNFTEDKLEDHNIDIDNYVEQAYQQGRAWLGSQVRSLADAKDPERANVLEAQVQQIVDNLYRMWEERDNTSPDTTAVAKADWFTQLKGVTDLQALKEELTAIIKENLDTLIGVAKSLWDVILSNLTFLSSVLAAFAGVILSFGMEIINFLIEVIVFLTMVYYLLSASNERWLPLEWASRVTSAAPTTNSGYDVTSAVEQAIFGVFVLSSKMAVFYGFYTFFVHSLFDLNIVFIPSMMAAVFAAIPIMAPYFVSVFGIFELWLVRGESAAALVFGLMSFAPLMFADATFYREMKSSHPYVTGLAIIGGIYWLGLQGAIIGPIILCSFLVLVNVYLQFVEPQGAHKDLSKKDN